jgi:hypothetical protein
LKIWNLLYDFVLGSPTSTGMPENIGLIAAFLVSDEARWLTEEIIFGSGGAPLGTTEPYRPAGPSLLGSGEGSG